MLVKCIYKIMDGFLCAHTHIDVLLSAYLFCFVFISPSCLPAFPVKCDVYVANRNGVVFRHYWMRLLWIYLVTCLANDMPLVVTLREVESSDMDTTRRLGGEDLAALLVYRCSGLCTSELWWECRMPALQPTSCRVFVSLA